MPKGDICIAADLFDHLVGECEQLVGNIEAEFLKPARMDEVLDVVTSYEEVTGALITLQQCILSGDELLIEARVRVAFVCGGQARPIPKPLRIAMKAEQD